MAHISRELESDAPNPLRLQEGSLPGGLLPNAGCCQSTTLPCTL